MGADPSGRKIAGYEVETELGQGGMGVVLLASQPSLARRVVLKTLRRDLHAAPKVLAGSWQVQGAETDLLPNEFYLHL